MNNGKTAVLPSERNIFLKKRRHFSKDEAQELSQCPISRVQPLPPVRQAVLGDPAGFTSITIASIFFTDFQIQAFIYCSFTLKFPISVYI